MPRGLNTPPNVLFGCTLPEHKRIAGTGVFWGLGVWGGIAAATHAVPGAMLGLGVGVVFWLFHQWHVSHALARDKSGKPMNLYLELIAIARQAGAYAKPARIIKGTVVFQPGPRST